MPTLQEQRERVLGELASIPAVAGWMAGEADVDAYVRYLKHAYAYARHSSPVMAIGASRCMHTHSELAMYLLDHSKEEHGHEHWALQDLEDLGVSRQDADEARLVTSCSALIGYVHYLAAFENPIALYGWLFVLEATGVDIGPSLGEALRAGLGDHGGATRFVSGHGVSDEGHTEELTEMIAKYLTDPADLAAAEYAGAVVGDLYVAMLQEIAAS